MKRFILFLIAGLFLIGCSLDTAVQDTTASIGGNGAQMIEVTVDRVWTDMRPLSNTNRANVLFRIEIDGDAAKLGSDSPIILYGGGTIVIPDEAFRFKDETRRTGEGKGQMTVCATDEPFRNGLFYPCGLPVMSLTAQIDGLLADEATILLTGTAVSTNAKEEVLEFPGLKIADFSELNKIQCDGYIIPNSSYAQIIMIGEDEVGNERRGGGLIYLGEAFDGSGIAWESFQCSQESAVRLAEASLDSGEKTFLLEHILLERLSLTLENGDTVVVNKGMGFLLC